MMSFDQLLNRQTLCSAACLDQILSENVLLHRGLALLHLKKQTLPGRLDCQAFDLILELLKEDASLQVSHRQVCRAGIISLSSARNSHPWKKE